MRIPFRSALPAVTLFATLACATRESASLTPADIEANRAFGNTFAERMVAKDLDGVAQLYADSALLLPPDSPPIRGRAAIREFLGAFPPVAEFTVTTEAVAGTAELVYVTGRYHLTLAAPNSSVDSGKFLDVRTKQKDGSWRYVADMFNSTAPAPATH